MTHSALQYEGSPQCRACGRTKWTRNSACCSCDTACCDLCAVGVLPTDELVCYRCAKKWFHCENCGSTSETVSRDAELIGEHQGFPMPDLPICCEVAHA